MSVEFKSLGRPPVDAACSACKKGLASTPPALTWYGHTVEQQTGENTTHLMCVKCIRNMDAEGTSVCQECQSPATFPNEVFSVPLKHRVGRWLKAEAPLAPAYSIMLYLLEAFREACKFAIPYNEIPVNDLKSAYIPLGTPEEAKQAVFQGIKIGSIFMLFLEVMKCWQPRHKRSLASNLIYPLFGGVMGLTYYQWLDHEHSEYYFPALDAGPLRLSLRLLSFLVMLALVSTSQKYGIETGQTMIEESDREEFGPPPVEA